MRITIGARTVVAASCRKCHRLEVGSRFGWHRRNARDKNAYIDQRCTMCKWGASAKRGRIER